MIANTLVLRSPTGSVKATSQAAGPRPNRRYAGGRTCEVAECSTQLSTYNPRRRCWVHEEPRPSYARVRPRVEEGPTVTSLNELARLLPTSVAVRHPEPPAEPQPEPFPQPRPVPQPEDPS